MNMHYNMPCGTYVIKLSKNDLEELLNKGYTSAEVRRTKCTASRSVYDKERDDLVKRDFKEVYNHVFFELNEPVADIEPGIHGVQFLRICLENKED